MWWPIWAVLIAWQAQRQLRPRTRYYLSPSRDAVLAITATRHGWHIGEHVSARPGTDLGRQLRARLIPQLLATADAEGITITTDTASATLAARYCAEVDGLVDVGKAGPRKRKLQRPPQQSR